MDPQTELLAIKNKLEQGISDLQNEDTMLLDQLLAIRTRKALIRSDIEKVLQKYHLIKIDLEDAKAELNVTKKSLDLLSHYSKSSTSSIKSTIGLTNYSDAVTGIRQAIQETISFYSEDSLILVSTKKDEVLRNCRVELTSLTNEYESKKREIEEAQRRIELQKKLELEERKREEEKLKRMEEERIAAEMEKQREVFLNQKLTQLNEPKQMTAVNPFRQVSFNLASPETDAKSGSPSNQGFQVSHGQDGHLQGANSNLANPSHDSSLSQYLRW